MAKKERKEYMKRFKATFYKGPIVPLACLVSDNSKERAFNRKRTFEYVKYVLGFPLFPITEEVIKLEVSFNDILDKLPFNDPFRIYNRTKELVCIIERVDEEYTYEDIDKEDYERNQLLKNNKKKKFKLFFNPPQFKVMIITDSGEPNTVSLDQAFEKVAELSGLVNVPQEELDVMKKNFFIELDRIKMNKGLKYYNEKKEVVCFIGRVDEDYTFSDMLDEEYGDL